MLSDVATMQPIMTSSPKFLVCWIVSMALVSDAPQQIAIGDLRMTVNFGAGERIHVENSYKYSTEEIEGVATAAGLRLERTWFDSNRRFCDALLAPV